MSINALANAAAARRPDTVPFGRVPKNLNDIAKASQVPPTTSEDAAGAQQGAVSENRTEAALNVLFGYIPTEIVTLYVAVLAAVGIEGEVTQTEWTACIAFIVATPVVVWLVYAAKVKASGLSLPVSYGAWPVWEMFAATLAFLAWTFALPASPFADYAWYSAALSGLVVLVASTILGLLAPFFQRELKS